MQYILTEEEFNSLQTKIECLEQSNTALRNRIRDVKASLNEAHRDMKGTLKNLATEKALNASLSANLKHYKDLYEDLRKYVAHEGHDPNAAILIGALL